MTSMFSNPQFSILTARKNLKWLSLLGSALLVLASLRSYFVLQLLSATLLFALLFAILASMVASFALLVIATDQILEWAAAEFASMLRSASHRFVTLGVYRYVHRSFLIGLLYAGGKIKRLI